MMGFVEEVYIYHETTTCKDLHCSNCHHRNDEFKSDVSAQHCEKGHWGNDSGINIDKMKCDEWFPKAVEKR